MQNIWWLQKIVLPLQSQKETNKTMNRTDFQKEIETIRNNEIAELIDALNECGGSFSFGEKWIEEGGEVPTIRVNIIPYETSICDVVVTNIEIDENGKLFIEGNCEEYGVVYLRDMTDIIVGDLSNIRDIILDSFDE